VVLNQSYAVGRAKSFFDSIDPKRTLPSFLLGASELPLANYFNIEIAGATLKYDVGPTTASSAALAGTR
jgi:hypothetical protein